MSAWAQLKAKEQDPDDVLPGEPVSETHRRASFDDVVLSGYRHRDQVPLDEPQYDESFEMIAAGRGDELTGESAFKLKEGEVLKLQSGSDDLGQVEDAPVDADLRKRWLLTAEVLCLIVGVIALAGLIFGLIALSGR